MNQQKTYVLDWQKYASLARQTAAEGVVLLENENQTLPIKKGEKVSIFGRSQLNYYKSGTGSGGLVNTSYVVGILEGLQNQQDIVINEELLEIYQKWGAENPFDTGGGWGKEPWCQVEMPIDKALVEKAAASSDIAVVIIGRTAGEDLDTNPTVGGFLLTDIEETMIEYVSAIFERTAIVLNVGNIIDMKWVQKYRPGAVLYAWQGGSEGGNGVADVLTGEMTPSGKLSDTIAQDIADYPSTAYFGNEFENCYTEDIYVGYRYFETVAAEKVLYPFGYGLSYTNFNIEPFSFQEEKDAVLVRIKVTNTGSYKGKEVVQVYASAPQGKLGKPSKVLCGFKKTRELQSGESEILEFSCVKKNFASYDDSGVTGYLSCFVLESGEYEFTAGNSVRSQMIIGKMSVTETMVLERLETALAPRKEFPRMSMQNGEMKLIAVQPISSDTIAKKKETRAYPEYSGDRKIRLEDVAMEKATMADFLAQLSEHELICMTRGEGMCSPKVTPGTAGAFGGVTEELLAFGIPLACCADGPSGIRMDCGTKAFSMPNGTAMACTFNTELIEQLFEMTALELRKNKIDLLLGPGMNIHRNPLNGRNFEYFSEDPYLTGQMAIAQLKALHKYQVSGTIKHFIANNQEFSRNYADSIVSERALREIYLKGFEMAVKEGQAISIMTMYGPVNGVWAASNYDLLTTILREQWGFKGSVMTDWWAMMNEVGKEPAKTNTDLMIRAQNDLYMVVVDAKANSMKDNTQAGLEQGVITRRELLQSAENICWTLLNLNVMERFYRPEKLAIIEEKNLIDKEQEDFSNLKYQEVYGETELDISDIKAIRGKTEVLGLTFKDSGPYRVEITVKAEASELAQLPITIYLRHEAFSRTLTGADKEWVTISHDVGTFEFPSQYLKIYFGQTGLKIGSIKFSLIEPKS